MYFDFREAQGIFPK